MWKLPLLSQTLTRWLLIVQILNMQICATGKQPDRVVLIHTCGTDASYLRRSILKDITKATHLDPMDRQRSVRGPLLESIPSKLSPTPFQEKCESAGVTDSLSTDDPNLSVDILDNHDDNNDPVASHCDAQKDGIL